MAFAFASVVSLTEIRAGEELTRDNIWVRRPGTGDFSAEDFFMLLGKRARREVKKGQQLKKLDVDL